MAEKRPRPHGDPAPNGVKKPRAEDGNGSKTISDAVTAARARAEAIQQKMAAGRAVPSTSPVPAAGASGLTPRESANARIEAMKAKAAATRAASTSSPQQRQPIASPPARPSERNDAFTRAKGGINIGVHPLLMEDPGNDQRAKAKGAMQPKFGTTIGNQRAQSPLERPGSGAKGRKQMDLDASKNPYFDPGLSAEAKARASRKLAFNARGKYIAQANAQRRQAQLEEMKKSLEASARRARLEEDRTDQAYLVKDVPDIEWWDEALVEGIAYPDFENDMDPEQKLRITTEDTLVVSQMYHPIFIEPPEYSKTTPKPMPLTKQEQAKKRRQERRADLQEEQAKVRLGLSEPEAPKVNRKNMFRVYGEEAVKDPTAVEMRVDREVAGRQDKHENMNEERKLTKEEREAREKEKATADAERGLIITVYRVGSLAYVKNRMKIDMNAKQCLDLTGMMLTNPKANLLIFEAGQRSTEFFKKLLQRRMDWTENAPSTVDPDSENKKGPVPQWLWPQDEGGQLKDLSENRCDLVWEGEKKKRAFGRWNEKDCETEGEVRETLERANMVNMWQMAKNWVAQ
ncbi:MAG: hypothetical protein M1828_006870 [Chrysothrix sp. TS-e1954]|nr:MAG: hypothetical protein M1828_006870 [Chrysothrix sp. TS-e1954]